jgi:hypothetical protein
MAFLSRWFRRAGWFDQSGEPMTVKRYSDNLLLALLRATRPEKFRDRSSVEFDVSDRLAERLESARQRLTKELPAVLELKANEVGE